MAPAGPGPGITAWRWLWDFLSSPLSILQVDGSYAAACPAPAAESVRKSEAPGCLAEESRLGW